MAFKDEYTYLVFNVGKVGSSTLFYKLLDSGLNAFHAHYLTDEYFIKTKSKDKYFLESKSRFDDYLRSKSDIKLRIITVIRDPIARDVSTFFHTLREKLLIQPELGVEMEVDKLLKDFVPCHTQSDEDHFVTENWFRDEFSIFTGINVEEYPFDKSKGYSIIKKKNIELLVIKLEVLSEIGNQALNEFIGDGIINLNNLENKNVTNNEFDPNLYLRFREQYSIGSETEKKLSDSAFINHFYSKSEIDNFLTKWSYQRFFSKPERTFINGLDSRISSNGFNFKTDKNSIILKYAGSSVDFLSNSEEIILYIKHNKTKSNKQEQFGSSRLQITVNNQPHCEISVSAKNIKFHIKNLPNNYSKISIQKITDLFFGECEFYGMEVVSNEAIKSVPNKNIKNPILFIGDGILSGFGAKIKSTSGLETISSFNQDYQNSFIHQYCENELSFPTLLGGYGFSLTANENLETYISHLNNKGNELVRAPKEIMILIGQVEFSNSISLNIIYEKYGELILKLYNIWGDVRITNLITPMLNDFYPEGEFNLSKLKEIISQLEENFKLNGITNIRNINLPTQSPENGYGEKWYPSYSTHKELENYLNEQSYV